MVDLVRKYRGYAIREIRWKLRHSMPESMVDQAIEQLIAERKALAARRAKKKAVDAAWSEVIESLQHERRIVRSMLKYKTKDPAPERDAFVDAYYAALTKAYDRLLYIKRVSGEAPEHSHWTDYVPHKIKDAFVEEALMIPPRHKAKIKQPFERTDPYDLYERRKNRLFRHGYKELETLQLKIEMDPEDEQSKRRMDRLRVALQRLREIEAPAHLPNHWTGLLDEDEKE